MYKYKTGFQDPPCSRPSPSHIPKPLSNSFGCDLAMERLSLSSTDRGSDASEKSVPTDVV
jgi:hypothetical protein